MFNRVVRKWLKVTQFLLKLRRPQPHSHSRFISLSLRKTLTPRATVEKFLQRVIDLKYCLLILTSLYIFFFVVTGVRSAEREAARKWWQGKK